jgi:tRNA modification GTPase
MIRSDTIVALSSGRLPAGVAVLRISGPRTRFVLETIAGGEVRPRSTALRRLVAPDGAVLDNGLVLFFPAPASFTGEDVAEFHVHGGRAVVGRILDTLTAFEGVRHAEPGEFTRRAFLNGKVNLVQTEALADLVNAETEAQRRFAVQNAGGAQAELYMGWRRRLLHARAMTEAEIDFADEDDVPGSVSDQIWADVGLMASDIERHVARYRSAEIIREGFDVVILGAPNAGKSSLFNALAGRDAAIVTDEPGTTRDMLEVTLELGGVLVRLTDTAGLREAEGKVEAIGIEKAKAKAATADLVLLLEDVSTSKTKVESPPGIPVLRVGTKIDLLDTLHSERAAKLYDDVISVTQGTSIDRLLVEIAKRAAIAAGGVGDVLPSRLRHVELLGETQKHLLNAISGGGQELRAEELRLAADQLGRIVGATDVEDMLDIIFGQFCIGK